MGKKAKPRVAALGIWITTILLLFNLFKSYWHPEVIWGD
jgi:hypothetical protein